MPEQHIIDFVKEQVARGTSRQEIDRILKINQLTEAEINEVWQLAGPIESPAAPMPPREAPPVTPPPPTPPETPPPPLIIEPSGRFAAAPFFMPTAAPPPAKKSRGKLAALIVVLLLLLAAGGATAYVYFYQPGLFNQLLGRAPGAREAEEKMWAALQNAKAAAFQIDFRATGNAAASSTPKNGQVQLNYTGAFDALNPQNLKSRGLLDGELSTGDGGMVFRFSAEQRSTDQVVYVKINQLPLPPGPFDTSKILNQWIKIPTQETASAVQNLEQLPPDLQNKARLAKEIWSVNHPIGIGQFVAAESVGDTKTYHYLLRFDKAKLKNLIRELTDAFRADLPARVSAGELAEGLDKINQAIDQTSLPNGEIWLGQENFLPYKIVLSKDIDYRENDQTLQGNFALAVRARNFNQPLAVETPNDARDIQEVIAEILGPVFGALIPGFATSTIATSTLMIPGR